MGVSLNIIKRELEAMGNVSISSDGSLDFENARLYLCLLYTSDAADEL